MGGRMSGVVFSTAAGNNNNRPSCPFPQGTLVVTYAPHSDNNNISGAIPFHDDVSVGNSVVSFATLGLNTSSLMIPGLSVTLAGTTKSRFGMTRAGQATTRNSIPWTMEDVFDQLKSFTFPSSSTKILGADALPSGTNAKAMRSTVNKQTLRKAAIARAARTNNGNGLLPFVALRGNGVGGRHMSTMIRFKRK